ncbi:hypothetical protein WK69_13525 [Burkholderia ubonensis]|nr:hypothetical protein WK69_13525 [Burkholderia ubonensis]
MRLDTLIREIRTRLAHQIIHGAVGPTTTTHVAGIDEFAEQTVHDVAAACEARFLRLGDESRH